MDLSRETGKSYSTMRKWLHIYEIKPKYKYRAAFNNLILYKSGNKPWNKGLNKNNKKVAAMSKKAGQTRKNKQTHLGSNNPNWKGQLVGYKRLHAWINMWKGKAEKCTKCGSTKNVDWANISGKYKRELSDYKELCRSCHILYDNKKRKALNEKNNHC